MKKLEKLEKGLKEIKELAESIKSCGFQEVRDILQIIKECEEYEETPPLYEVFGKTEEKPKNKYEWVKFPFGKYQGRIVKEILEENKGYLEWMNFKSGIELRGLLKEAFNELESLGLIKEEKNDSRENGILYFGFEHPDGDGLFDAMDGSLPNQ